MKKNIILIILIILSIGFAVLSFCILPELVIIQFSNSSSGNTVVPKIIAILIPLALGIGGALFNYFNKSEGKSNKGLIVSIVGIVLFVIMIVVNGFK